MRPPRERAARALCALQGNPEDAAFEGEPMWQSYLPDVDAVLQAALTPEAWAGMLDAEPKKPPPR